MAMAHYDIFREQLAFKFPEYGHALWEPNPRRADRPVQVGDVGFVRRGKFHRLFNALLPPDDSSHDLGVPEYHEQLVPNLSDHIDEGFLSPNHYCSAGISVETEPDFRASGPEDFRRVSFSYSRKRGGAVLSLPLKARREDTLAQRDFGEWIVKHIDRCFAFVRRFGLGIEQMEEIVLVTGCDRARSWTNVAFSGGQADAQVSFGMEVVNGVDAPDTGINFQFSPEHVRGAVVNQGPEGRDLPENQCVFIRGFRVARTLRILPKHLKAAAGPTPDSGDHGCEPDAEPVSIPAITNYRDPLHLLVDYIAEQASDCDMVLVHDDDLRRIDWLGEGAPSDFLQPDTVADILRKSNTDIYEAQLNGTSPSTDADVVRVAMLSTTFQSWRRSASPEGDPPHLTVSPVTGIAPQSHLPLMVPGLHRTRKSSALSPGRRPLQPTSDVQHFIGYVETTTDALRLVMAARQGIIPRITRRFDDSERRSMIRSGAVVVFCVEESGIKRWTEGLSWSRPRIVGNFLMYREVGERNSNQGADTALFPPGTPMFRGAPPNSPANSYYHGRSDPRDPSGAARSSDLIKKTITIKISGTDHHLVSYYREDDVARGLLQRPTSRPDIMRLTIPPEMVRATNFRHPPHIEIGPDGNVHIYDAEEADSTRRQYDRALLSSPPNLAAPSSDPDHMPVYPIRQSEAPSTRLPARNFGVERPLGPQFSRLSLDPARARTTHCRSPPSTPGDPSTTPHGARSSLRSPLGAAFSEANSTANMSRWGRYLSYAVGLSSPYGPSSPDITHAAVSSARSLDSMTQYQTQSSSSASPGSDEDEDSDTAIREA